MTAEAHHHHRSTRGGGATKRPRDKHAGTLGRRDFRSHHRSTGRNVHAATAIRTGTLSSANSRGTSDLHSVARPAHAGVTTHASPGPLLFPRCRPGPSAFSQLTHLPAADGSPASRRDRGCRVAKSSPAASLYPRGPWWFCTNAVAPAEAGQVVAPGLVDQRPGGQSERSGPGIQSLAGCAQTL